MMQVLALNSSPQMENGHTALILDPFVNGMKKEGADVELVYLRKLKISPCLSDKSCWFKTAGECIQNDDMKLLVPKVRKADVMVFAMPVYVDGMPGPLKNFFDRLIPILEPYMEVREDHCRHILREGHKRSRVVLISTCGFWEMDNFDPLIMHMQAICKNTCWEYAGAVLRPHSDALSYMLRKNLYVGDIIEAAQEAGRQLIRDGSMKDETLKIVARKLGNRQDFLEKLNNAFRKASHVAQ